VRKLQVASILFIASTMAAITTSAHAQAPGLIPVQGFLSTSDGSAVDGAHRLTFALFDSESGGTQLFTDDYTSIDLDAGHFVVYLGAQDGKPLDLSTFDGGGDLWLEVVIDGTEVISPRMRLGTVPFSAYAQYCGDAATLGGASIDDFGGLNGVAALNCADGETLRWSASDSAWRCEPAVLITRTSGKLPDIRVAATMEATNYLAVAAQTWVQVTGRELDFTKRYADSLLKITYQDTLGTMGRSYDGCTWRILVDGSQVALFSAGDGERLSGAGHWKMANGAHQTWVEALAAGAHKVTVEARGNRGAWNSDYTVGTKECLMGWNTSGNFLSVEEYP